MSAERYLFPQRKTRREFLELAGASLAATSLCASHSLADSKPTTAVTIGSGKWTYTLDDAWGKLPTG